MGKDDLGPLPFKATETSVCLKRQLPFYVAAFEPTCDERSAHAELCLPSCWVARGQQQLKAHLSPGGACRAPFSHPASLPSVAETLAATRTPGHPQGSAVSAGDTAGSPNCSRFSCTPRAEQPGELGRTSRPAVSPLVLTDLVC